MTREITQSFSDNVSIDNAVFIVRIQDFNELLDIKVILLEHATVDPRDPDSSSPLDLESEGRSTTS